MDNSQKMNGKGGKHRKRKKGNNGDVMKDDDDVEKNNPVLITYKDAKPIVK